MLCASGMTDLGLHGLIMPQQPGDDGSGTECGSHDWDLSSVGSSSGCSMDDMETNVDDWLSITPAVEPPPPTLASELREMLEGYGVQHSGNVWSVADACTMEAGHFGKATERVRSRCLALLAASGRGKAVVPTPRHVGQQALVLSAPGVSLGPPLVCAAALLGPAAASSTSLVLSGEVAPSPSTPSVGTVSGDVLDCEARAAGKAADEFMRVCPAGLLFWKASNVPYVQRWENKRKHLYTLGTGSIQLGTRAVSEWVGFCERNQLGNWGIPVDEDSLLWCLREADEAARRRALSNGGKRTGVHSEHALACGFRWLADNLDMPFGAAKAVQVRKASRPNRSVEPAWAAMWELGVLVHMLRIAVLYAGPRATLVRPWAAATYAVMASSLRIVDGQRSAPPVLATDGCLASCAKITKGRSRRVQQPLPWAFPTISPDPALSDNEVQLGLVEAFSLLPNGAMSMFMGNVNAAGKLESLQRASGWGTARATDARTVTSVAHLLTWQPLGLSKAAARKIAEAKHGPRHIFPELGRVAMLPLPARYELGYWKGKAGGGGRLGALPNRYSRDGERLCQRMLRSFLLRWVRARLVLPPAGALPRPTLEDMAATPVEMGEVQLVWADVSAKALLLQ